MELIPTLRFSLIVSSVRSTVKFMTRSTMASARTVTLTHIMAPSEEPEVKVTGIMKAMKSPSVSEAGMHSCLNFNIEYSEYNLTCAIDG